MLASTPKLATAAAPAPAPCESRPAPSRLPPGSELRHELGAALQTVEVVPLAVVKLPGARGRIHLAGAYIAQGQDSQAERELRGALEIDPDLPDAHYGLALVLLRRGQKLPALEQLRIVISLSPKFQPAYQAAIQILESLPASENTTQEAQKLRQRLNALFTTTKQLR